MVSDQQDWPFHGPQQFKDDLEFSVGQLKALNLGLSGRVSSPGLPGHPEDRVSFSALMTSGGLPEPTPPEPALLCCPVKAGGPLSPGPAFLLSNPRAESPQTFMTRQGKARHRAHSLNATADERQGQLSRSPDYFRW